MTDDILETPSSTPNFRTELAAQLAELMPEVVADGKIDVVKLQELLGEDSSGGAYSERFGLFWPGKARALRAAQEPTTATLKPDFENSKDWDTTKNVFIEGDNLEVLKILQKHYHGNIKMIYIDPPYNTGKDFVYKDNYTEGLQSYLEQTQQWADGKKLTSNSESEGRYHSNWLNMMYPRLKLARNLLTDDGVIFISIDDNEAANLMKLCSEIFGEDNFIATFMWKRKKEISSDSKNVAIQGEYVLAYGRSASSTIYPEALSDDYVASSYYEPTAQFPLGKWRPVPLTVSKGLKGGGYDYEVITPSGKSHRRLFAYPQKSFSELLANGRVYFGKSGDGVPQRVIYAHESKGQPVSNFWSDIATNKEGKKQILEIFGDNVFDTPKPTALVKKLLTLAAGSNDIVLDFFSGSGTTGHAVMELNAEDGGTRQWIQVQLPEPTPEDSLARAEGFETISAISRKRLELAAAKIESESASQLSTQDTYLDLGFRSFKLVDTNFSKWRVESDIAPDQLEQRLLGLRDSADDDATADDLLTEILLKQGYSLTEQIAPVEIAGLELRSVGEGVVLAYLNEHVKPTLEQLREIVAAEPSKLIVLEDAFHGDDELKTNTAQLCKSKGIEFWTA